MAEKDQANRWRCCVVDCNPVLKSEAARDAHVKETGHRTAKWPVRSAAGKKLASDRNKNGYYAQYNVGHKARRRRGGSRLDPEMVDRLASPIFREDDDDDDDFDPDDDAIFDYTFDDYVRDNGL